MSYIGQSRSVNSAIAIEEGKLTYSQLKAWQKRAVDAGKVRSCEWHHTGKYFNETRYYDPDDFAELRAADFPPIKEDPEPDIPVTVCYIYWTGTRKHPHPNEDTISAVMRGDWLYGNFADGCKKKNYFGNNIKSVKEIES
jgi:hypothetical protein